MEHFRQILNRLPPTIGQELAGLPGSVLCSLEEIRLRCGQQVRLETGKGTQRIPHIVTAEELPGNAQSPDAVFILCLRK